MKRFLTIVLFSTLSIVCFGQSIDKEIVAFQMNSCVMSLTNLNESQSLPTYEKERENLINNLSKEGMAKLPEITELRESILGTIYQLEITQEEREVLKKIKALDKEGEKWRAVSNGLNQAMVLIPSGRSGNYKQAAFYALLTAARSAVDYAASSKEGDSEEARALWEIRKHDLENYAWLNTEAYKKINEIFKTYHLSDVYELTPKQASEFNKLISDSDPSRRCQKLLNNASTYRFLNEYNYYLGMAYVQMQEFNKAQPYFNRYIANSQKAKIYKIDEKLGCIYLAKLTYETNVSKPTIEFYISEALKNLRHNGPAYIQCATAYCTELQDKEKAFGLLQEALYDDMLTDKESIIMTITEWISQIKNSPKYESIFSTICSSMSDNLDYVSLNSYLHFLVSSSDDRAWSEIDNLIRIAPKKDKLKINGEFKLSLAKNLCVKSDHIQIFSESFNGNKLKVKEQKVVYPKGFTQAFLMRRFAIFKDNPDLLYLFFNYNDDAKQYYIKRTLSLSDFNILTKTPYEFNGISAFHLELSNKKSADRKNLQKVVDFCRKKQKYSPESSYLICKPCSSRKREKSVQQFIDCSFAGHDNILSYAVSDIKSSNSEDDSFKRLVFFQKGSEYYSSIYRGYNSESIRVIIRGSNAPDIVLKYSIANGVGVLSSIEDNGIVRFRFPVSVTAKEKENNEIVAESQAEETAKESRFINWIKSFFSKKPIDSDNVSDEKPSVQEEPKPNFINRIFHKRNKSKDLLLENQGANESNVNQVKKNRETSSENKVERLQKKNSDPTKDIQEPSSEDKFSLIKWIKSIFHKKG